MIHSLRGTLLETGENLLIIECAGVGYAVRTTSGTLSALPKVGKETRVYTHMSVREDAVELFGFSGKRELDCFRMLITVNGVGPKAALAILSELSPDKLLLAVAAGDAKAITKAPGVGPKLASRVVLELAGKLGEQDILPGFSSFAPDAPASQQGEALSALVALGYSQSEAATAVSKCPADWSTQEIIKGGLKFLSSGK